MKYYNNDLLVGAIALAITFLLGYTLGRFITVFVGV